MIAGMIDVDACFRHLDLDALRRRRGVKWSAHPPDVLPAWVADMDFPVAPAIRDALMAALDRDDLGYPPDYGASGVAEAFATWATRWGWTFDPALTHLMPDVVKAIEDAIEAFTRPGDAIVVNTAVYPPFLKSVARSGRVLAASALTAEHGIDLDDMARLFATQRPTMVLLCNPHNPHGRVLRREELAGIAQLAIAHDAVIVSDEIHADLSYDGYVHVPIATLGPEVAERTITLTSASKAFNVAGLRCALAITGTAEHHRLLAQASEVARDAVGTLGIEAALAAWSPAGEAWLDACRRILAANRDTIARWATDQPGIVHRPPEATYLAWLDCRALALEVDPAAWFLQHARVALSSGSNFGPPGQGFARLNFATSPAILEQILTRLTDAIEREPQRPVAPSRQ